MGRLLTFPHPHILTSLDGMISLRSLYRAPARAQRGEYAAARPSRCFTPSLDPFIPPALLFQRGLSVPVVMDADRMGRTLTRIAHEIVERNRGVEELALVG